MTGLIFDPELHPRHDRPGHAENAARLSLAQDLVPGDAPFQTVPLRPATDTELTAVHTPAHIQRVSAMCAKGGGMLDPDTYCGPDSEFVARAGAGGLVDLCRGVWQEDYRNGLALIRPPGHHATADQAMGFCLYNNVAVAAAALLDGGLRKVAVVDCDVHHGNGTQDIFYDRDDVLYLSSHQYPHYPGSGAAAETGLGVGLGYTVNQPLPEGTGDEDFLAAYRDVLLPSLAAYAPEFIIVSAGFDAHEADPLAGLTVTTSGYVALVRMLVAAAENLCAGRIVFALEGGYDPAALAACIAGTAGVLTDPDSQPGH